MAHRKLLPPPPRNALTAMASAKCAESSKVFLDVSSRLPPAHAVMVKAQSLPSPAPNAKAVAEKK